MSSAEPNHVEPRIRQDKAQALARKESMRRRAVQHTAGITETLTSKRLQSISTQRNRVALRSGGRDLRLVLTACVLCLWSCAAKDAGFTDAESEIRPTKPSTDTEAVGRVDTPRGIYIEDLRPGLLGERAGLQPGDVLERWELRREGENRVIAQGHFRSGWEAGEALTEQAPRGQLTLLGMRDGMPLSASGTGSDNWGLSYAPHFNQPLWDHYLGLRALEKEDPAAAAEGLEVSARLLEELGEAARLDAAFLWQRAAQSWLDASPDGDRWTLAFQEAQRNSEAAQSQDVSAILLEAEGVALMRRGRFQEAATRLRRVSDLRPEESSLRRARALEILAIILRAQGHMEEALSLITESVDIYEQQTPNSLRLAKAWSSLGRFLSQTGDQDRAEALFQKSLKVRLAVAPESPDAASGFSDLAVLHAQRGDLAEAQEFFEQELDLRERFEAGDRWHALLLSNLGAIASFRGDWGRAEWLGLESLRLDAERGALTASSAPVLGNLANAALKIGDLETASSRQQQALDILAEAAPDGLDHAVALRRMAQILRQQERPIDAKSLLQRAAAVAERAAPGSWQGSLPLLDLADLASEQGEWLAAERWLEMAQGPLIEQARNHPLTGKAFLVEGDLALARNDSDRACAAYENARAVFEHLAPSTSSVARARHGLGRCERARGELEKATLQFELAVRALENQQARVAAEQDAARLGDSFQTLFDDFVAVLLEQGREQEALLLIERLRARQLSERLQNRDLEMKAIPENLDRRRRRLNAEYQRLLNQLLSEPPSADNAALDDRVEALRRNERERAVLRAKLENEFDLGPFSAAGAGPPESLLHEWPRGMVLLSYYLGRERAYVFAAVTGVVVAIELESSSEQLTQRVDRFLRLISNHGPPASVLALHVAGVNLYEELVNPAIDALGIKLGAGSASPIERLVIVPHGILHRLPFAALRQASVDDSLLGPRVENGKHHEDEAENEGEQGVRYLVEALPIVFASSVTSAVATLGNSTSFKRMRPAASDTSDVPTSAPTFDLAVLADAADRPRAAPLEEQQGLKKTPRSMAQQQLAQTSPSPLPWARTEARVIASLFDGAKAVWVGDEATAAHAQLALSEARVVHFAVHGFNDHRLPMDSGLAFHDQRRLEGTAQNLEGERPDDALLQAWEILELAPINADLVTLSACEAGRGLEVGLNAPFGLPRALQAAGARTVVAPIWRVDDRATATLMTQFYRGVTAGQAKDQALRHAQIAMLQGSTSDESGSSANHPIRSLLRRLRGRSDPTARTGTEETHPYYWASFRVEGGWQPLGDG